MIYDSASYLLPSSPLFLFSPSLLLPCLRGFCPLSKRSPSLLAWGVRGCLLSNSPSTSRSGQSRLTDVQAHKGRTVSVQEQVLAATSWLNQLFPRQTRLRRPQWIPKRSSIVASRRLSLVSFCCQPLRLSYPALAKVHSGVMTDHGKHSCSPSGRDRPA